MKLSIYCADCITEGVQPSEESVVSVEFTDDGRYQIGCPKGHSSTIVLQQQKFEVLFEIGVYAILDAYYREAVSSFTTSLERFYEYFIKVVLLAKGLDAKGVEESWKLVANQSERQLGAFIFLYTSEFRKSPRLLNNNRTRFRNDVTHKGKIPKHQEAIDYGQAILDVLRPMLREVMKRFPNEVAKTIQEHLYGDGIFNQEGKRASVLTTNTIVSLSFNEPGKEEPSLQAYLDRFVKPRSESTP